MTVSIRPSTALPVAPLIIAERPKDRAGVDGLIDAAFGPGRFVKAAERLREGRQPRLDLSFTAWEGERLVGCVRQWDIHVGERPAIFLGPIVVDPAWRRHGLGAALIEQACAAAWAAGAQVVLLVGDAPFFQPLGFEPVPRGALALPGPADPRRILAKGPQPGVAATLSGVVVAR